MAKRARLKRGYYWRGPFIWTRDPTTGKRTSTGCADPTAAELWRARRERIAADPVHAAATSATVGKWQRRLMGIKAATKSEGTQHMYGVKLGHVARLFGADSPMTSITAERVDAYIATRRTEGAGSNTISRELTCLRQMLKHAKRAGEYAGDIASVMPLGFSAEYKPVTRTLRQEDLPKLLAALKTDEQRAWVCLAISFAADLSDIEKMLPEHFDHERQQMHVYGTKTDTRDAWLPVLPLFAELVAWAVPHLPVSWPRASKALGEACTRAGLPHLSPKDLRRSAASWLLVEGANQSLVSRFLRHSSDIMVRKVYGQLRPEELGKLLSDQTENGTPASHQRGPLGEIGRRRGLKRPSSTPGKCWKGRKHAAQFGAASPAEARFGTHLGTRASQLTPRLAALVDAARAVGL
jgi:integrase